MRIAMIHFRVGATDGVSLEMDKWKTQLEKLGHTVIYVAGETFREKGRVIPGLNIHSKTHHHFFHNAYESLDDYENEDAFLDAIYKEARSIEDALKTVFTEEAIDCVIPNNVSSLGLNLPVGIAMAHVISDLNLKVIYHHHDFYWERDRYSHPTVSGVQTLLNTYFPADHPKAVHCVINHIARINLLERRNIESIVVPNVFDFSEAPWTMDEYNDDLKKALGIKENDIVFLQATRIEDRKAIELALDTIETVHDLLKNHIGKPLYNHKTIQKDTKIYLIMPGLNELRSDKFKVLEEKIKHVSFEVLFINELTKAKREATALKKYYALWDMYAISDFVTYPSILEGWGNQFIEAIFAKKPILIYEYPVYLSDIKPLNFSVVSLGKNHVKTTSGLAEVPKDKSQHAASLIIDLLLDENLYLFTTESNFEIAQKALSFSTLENQLGDIIKTKLNS
jgi:mannosylglucosylglycerate synthase